MESTLSIIITVLMTVTLAVLGWFISLLYRFAKSLETLAAKIGQLETRQAVDESEKKTIWKKLDAIEAKIDKVLAPGFFRECPHWKEQ